MLGWCAYVMDDMRTIEADFVRTYERWLLTGVPTRDIRAWAAKDRARWALVRAIHLERTARSRDLVFAIVDGLEG